MRVKKIYLYMTSHGPKPTRHPRPRHDPRMHTHYFTTLTCSTCYVEALRASMHVITT